MQLSVSGSVITIFIFISEIQSFSELIGLLKGEVNIYSENITYKKKGNINSMFNLTCQPFFTEDYFDYCEVTIDNDKTYKAPLDGLIINPGEHTIDVRKNGYIGEHAEIILPAGANIVFNFILFNNNMEGANKRNQHIEEIVQFNRQNAAITDYCINNLTNVNPYAIIMA